MAVSKTSLCNAALAELGDKNRRISDFDSDGSTPAQHCRDQWEFARDECFARLDWSCVRKVDALTQHANDPTLETWTYKYSRPADAILIRKIIDTSENENDFLEITDSDGRMIYANIDDAYCWYSYNNDDPNTWSPGLRKLIVATLAAKIALPVTGKLKIKEAMELRLLRYVERMSKAADQVEQYVEDEAGVDSVVDEFE